MSYLVVNENGLAYFRGVDTGGKISVIKINFEEKLIAVHQTTSTYSHRGHRSVFPAVFQIFKFKDHQKLDHGKIEFSLSGHTPEIEWPCRNWKKIEDARKPFKDNPFLWRKKS